MESSPKIFLGGGGSEEDEAKIWDVVFSTKNKPDKQCIAVWPQAQPEHNHAAVLDWFTGALALRGDARNFTILPQQPSSSSKKTSSESHASKDKDKDIDTNPTFGLDKADILFIPGGNTFHLLAFMRENNLLTRVREFVSRGGRVFGGSAGAIVLGADIGICDVANGGLDENDIGMLDTEALGLLGADVVVYPHFRGVEGASQHAACQGWANRRCFVVVAMPERCGVAVADGGVAWNAGPEEVWFFVPRRPVRKYAAGECWSLHSR
jgi:dipeptidase E